MALLLSGLSGAFAATDAVTPTRCERVRISADPDYPPLHWYDGSHLQGASIEVATRVFKDLGIPYSVEYMGPWTRVLASAKAGEIDVVTTLKDTPERRSFLSYPTTPAFANPIVIYVARGQVFAYAKWSDLIGRQGGMTLGNVFGGGFDEYLEAKLKVEAANTPEINFGKLELGRIDYFITGLYTGAATLVRLGKEDRFTTLMPPVTETANYVAFVKASPCSAYLPAFDRRLAELVRAGVVEKIVAGSVVHWRHMQAPAPTKP